MFSTLCLIPPLRSTVARRLRALPAALSLVPCLCLGAFAQTTTISGTVYDPRTTANALPLPSVLVYVTTGTVASLPAGVQCLTVAAPNGAASYTNSDVSGNFTLKKVPENTSYTLVIQSGKWRRQFPVTVGSMPVTGLALHMPSDHTQGDIPLIAIVTGEVDGVECVVRNMGIADTEFTDDTGTVNPGGRIHLYQGGGGPGAFISDTTPSESTLTSSSSLLSTYDMAMFPCQGSPYDKTRDAETNLVNYANAGGRLFTTHFSYVWLDPDYGSQFPPVADWDLGQGYAGGDPGVGTVNTSFTDGATLSQWLQNAGALYQNVPNAIQISTIRIDLQDVIPPTQPWLTLNDPTNNNPVMQMTFNAPVGAPANAQCGRVLFNEYHVVPLSQFSGPYPTECGNTSTAMSPQEEMLEYALFDLSAFVQPVVVPSLDIEFDPSPLVVKQGDTGDQVAINVTNTSLNTAVDPSAVLKLTLPPLLTATGLTDANGNWNCTASTLTCTRTVQLTSGMSDAVVLTMNVATGGSGNPTGRIVATVSDPIFSTSATASDTVIFRQLPTITWATPAPIPYGTPLSGVQLDATASVPGSFTYLPAAGTVLNAGQQALTATFSPTDTSDYATATASVMLTVLPLGSTVTLTVSPNPTFVTTAVTFAAKVSSPGGAPSGAVTFYDGTTTLGSGSVSAGRATFSTSALTMGVHPVTAAFAAGQNVLAATSLPVNETVEDFTIALDGAGGSKGTTVYPGQEAQILLAVTPVGGATMPAAIDLSVTGLPPGAVAVFSPATVAARSGVTTLTLAVTPSTIGTFEERAPLGPWAPVLAVVLLSLAGRLRNGSRRWRGLVVLALAAALALSITACGGITYTPRNFAVTVMATSGNLSHSTPVSLTVE